MSWRKGKFCRSPGRIVPALLAFGLWARLRWHLPAARKNILPRIYGAFPPKSSRKHFWPYPGIRAAKHRSRKTLFGSSRKMWFQSSAFLRFRAGAVRAGSKPERKAVAPARTDRIALGSDEFGPPFCPRRVRCAAVLVEKASLAMRRGNALSCSRSLPYKPLPGDSVNAFITTKGRSDPALLHSAQGGRISRPWLKTTRPMAERACPQPQP